MGSPSDKQRVDAFEDRGESVSEMVKKAVERAMEAMRHSLEEWVVESKRKLREEVDTMAGRLEGRINCNRELQESLPEVVEGFASHLSSVAMGPVATQIGINDVGGGFGGRNRATSSWVSGGAVKGDVHEMGDPNMYYAHEYEPPPVSLPSLYTNVSFSPQMFEENYSKQSASKVFDESSEGIFVQKAPTSISQGSTLSPKMNSVTIKSWKSYVDFKKEALEEFEAGLDSDIEMSKISQGLTTILAKEEMVTTEMNSVRDLMNQLQQSCEESKYFLKSQALRTIQNKMNSNVALVLKTSRSIKAQLEDMDQSNAVNRRLFGCKEGTAVDQTRSTVTNGLRKKLKELMMEFQALRQKMMTEYKDTGGRKYYTVTGEYPIEDMIERLISDHKGGEEFLARSIQEHGKGKVLETVAVIQDRHDATKEIERSLLELHQGTNPIICSPNPYWNTLKTHCNIVKLHENEYGKCDSKIENVNSLRFLFESMLLTDITHTIMESNGNRRGGGTFVSISPSQTPKLSEKDESVKAVMHLKVMHLKSSEIDEGYITDVVVSRQNLLVDVRDELLFEPEYAGNIRANVLPKAYLRIPWAWLLGALCLLQEVGEEKRVLDIGRSAPNHADSRLYTHELLFSMALAECAIVKISFEKNKISQKIEALARVKCLLRSKVSTGQMSLLSQIEESLEELAPACTLEILGMPNTPENAERRPGANAALHELIKQGLDVETTCQVQDWPCFLYQALSVLMAAEMVELLPGENLASIQKSGKSIESQNQRIVMDFHCFYLALIAHIALGFSTQQRDLIGRAKVISESLIALEGTDLKFEEVCCLFLLGQGGESLTADKLRQLNLNLSTTTRNLISRKESMEMPSANQSPESWMREKVLVLFPDTRNFSPSLYLAGEKKAEKKQYERAQPIPSSINLGPLSHGTFDRKTYGQPDSSTNFSQHLGTAVNQLSPSNLQSPSVAVQVNSGNNDSLPSVQMKRNLGAQHCNAWAIWYGEGDSDYIYAILVAFLDERGVIFDLEDKVVLWERGIVMDWPKSEVGPIRGPRKIRTCKIKEGNKGN